jgi:nitrate reductase assembly molybdenum cofactor insertion protein NarJ
MNATFPATDGPTRTLLAQAAAWRLLGLLFERPIEGWHAEAASLAEIVADPLLQEAAAAARQEAAAGLYDTTFGPGGPASLREVSYRQMDLSGQFLGSLCAYYQAFLFQPAQENPPDHVAFEIGFVAYLLFKEAYARSCGEEERAAVAAEARSRFLEEHLSILAVPLVSVLEASGIRYLALAAVALTQRVLPPPGEPPG